MGRLIDERLYISFKKYFVNREQQKRKHHHVGKIWWPSKGLNRGVNYDPESKQEPRFSKQVKDESYQKGTAKGSFK